MAKFKLVLKIIIGVILVLLIYVFVCMVIPPLFRNNDSTSATALASEMADVESSATERVLNIEDNTDALVWRLRLINSAKENLVLVTFDFRDDNSGNDIMSALYDAAERGVEVKILVDGMNEYLYLKDSETFATLAAHENVEVKVYNPISFVKLWKDNYRMHDKYVIADDFAYIFGGRNTDDLFLGDYQDWHNEDRDILVYEETPGGGESIQELNTYFETIWNSSYCKVFSGKSGDDEGLKSHFLEVQTLYPEAYTETDWEEETFAVNSIELCTNSIEAGNKYPALWERMVEEMKNAEQITVQTPYIICSSAMYDDLAEICETAELEIIINAVEIGSNPFGCTDYLNQKKNIQKTGLTTYEYTGEHAQHTKAVLIDDNISIVGSCNFDMRSVYIDTEMMLIIDSEELNSRLRDVTEDLKASSVCVSPDGTETEGQDYEAIEISTGKKITYNIMRAITLPIRHLL